MKIRPNIYLYDEYPAIEFFSEIEKFEIALGDCKWYKAGLGYLNSNQKMIDVFRSENNELNLNEV